MLPLEFRPVESLLSSGSPRLRDTGAWIVREVAGVGIGASPPLCPWATRSVGWGLMRFAVVGEGGPKEVDLPSTVQEMEVELAGMRPLSGPRSIYRVAGVVVSVDTPTMRKNIDKVHRSMKPDLLDRGLLLGRAHRERSRVSGRQDVDFTMRSPLPILLLRLAIPADARLFETSNSSDSRAKEAFDTWLTGSQIGPTP